MESRDPVTPFITAVLAERDRRAGSDDASPWPRRQPPAGPLPAVTRWPAADDADEEDDQ